MKINSADGGIGEGELKFCLSLDLGHRMIVHTPDPRTRLRIESDLDRVLCGSGDQTCRIRDVVDFLAAKGVRTWIVGGAPRDWVQGCTALDIDLACQERWETVYSLLAGAFPQGQFLGPPNPKLGLFSWGSGGESLDINMLRTLRRINPVLSIYQQDFVLAETIAEDAQFRDFTINALYFDPHSGTIQDPSGRGLEAVLEHELELVCPQAVANIGPYLSLRAIKFICKGYTPSSRVIHLLEDRLERDIQQAGPALLTNWLRFQMVMKGNPLEPFHDTALPFLPGSSARSILLGAVQACKSKIHVRW